MQGVKGEGHNLGDWVLDLGIDGLQTRHIDGMVMGAGREIVNPHGFFD